MLGCSGACGGPQLAVVGAAGQPAFTVAVPKSREKARDSEEERCSGSAWEEAAAEARELPDPSVSRSCGHLDVPPAQSLRPDLLQRLQPAPRRAGLTLPWSSALGSGQEPGRALGLPGRDGVRVLCLLSIFMSFLMPQRLLRPQRVSELL